MQRTANRLKAWLVKRGAARLSTPDIQLLFVIAVAISIASFAYFFANDMTNVYGDGVARTNIARKVVDSPDDSLWQRYIQIGSPWLPLPTVLMLPFVANDSLWRSGLAGSLLSMIGFVVTALAIFAQARELYGGREAPYARALPWLSAAIFLGNPSAIYMQSTPMTESLFMATLAGAMCLLQRWQAKQEMKRLLMAGGAMTMATMVRYEAWPVAAMAAVFVAIAARGDLKKRAIAAVAFAALAGAAPLYWLWHNWAIYGNALEFLTGPYSARGLYLQNAANLGWAKVFVGNLPLDIALMMTTAAVCLGPLLLLLAMIGFARVVWDGREAWLRFAPAFLLLVPFAFHIYSLYRGEIQIFPLSAFGLLNVRYGLPHLLAAAVYAPAAALCLRRFGWKKAVGAVALLVVFQYGWLISEGADQLAIYQEGYRNGVNARPARQRARLSDYLRREPPAPIIWMHTGALGPVVARGGLRFADLIHEGTARWHAIGDTIPADVATVILQEGDPLDRRIRERPALLRDLESNFHLTFDQDTLRVYRRHSAGGD